ncbi:outer membrane protein, multidrug efflux system [Duganella sp. CF458]|uniref:efflux transporter outer membrane subunit n=1 Tax=Duganella sp. CF458 TaxID=1884368 RepID=UPI0008F0F0E1|nr:efflux transporter outer membrane subunit [Duganella sp. CF458]SFG13235.1 outer membrane protein, multidrug efflux system [Duganella sp. CF458]
MNKSLFALAVAAVLSGCSLAPVHQRPAAPVAQQWPSGEAYKPAGRDAEVRAAADIGWREFISDESLAQVVQLALDHNRDLRVSVLNIDKAREQHGVASAERLPHVNASVGQTAQRVSGKQSPAGSATVTRQYSGGLGIPAFELDFFGRVKNMSESALQQYLATEEARRAQHISLVAEVASAWLTLAADQEHLRLAEDTLKNQQITFEIAKHRFESGATSGLDMYEAQTSAEAARNDAAIYRAQVAAGVNALDLLAGTRVPATLLPQGSLQQVTKLADLQAGVPSTVLQQRPDVLEAERSLKAANADIGVARAAFFPSISLTAFAGSASTELSGLFKAGTGTWSFSPQVNLPVFAGGANKANLEVARSNHAIALAQYEKAIQSAFREVADALAQRGTLDERVESQALLADAAERSHRIHEARYQKGVESYLNALVSQRVLYSARHGLINARLAKVSNQVTLYKVLGGGWK